MYATNKWNRDGFIDQTLTLNSTQKFTYHMIGLQLIQRATQVQDKEKLGAIY